MRKKLETVLKTISQRNLAEKLGCSAVLINHVKNGTRGESNAWIYFDNPWRLEYETRKTNVICRKGRVTTISETGVETG